MTPSPNSVVTENGYKSFEDLSITVVCNFDKTTSRMYRRQLLSMSLDRLEISTAPLPYTNPLLYDPLAFD